MSTATTPSRKPFQSKTWMLPKGVDAQASSGSDVTGEHIDTDGDGIADTLALRVETSTTRRSWIRTVGSWTGRFIVAIVVVASLAAAAAAATSLYYARNDLQHARRDLAFSQSNVRKARASIERSRAQVDQMRTSRDAARADVARLQSIVADSELNLRALRYLMRSEQPVATTAK